MKVRTILKNDLGPLYLARARKERQAFTQKLWELKNKERRRAYWREHRKKLGTAFENERKRKWRERNRKKVAAYHREYFHKNPERQEYLRQKKREYRAANQNRPLPQL